MQTTPTSPSERRLAVGDIEINVAVAGRGPAVLLLHGWPHTWRLWRRVIPRLVDAGHRVIAPDLRGVGGTTRARAGYDLDALVADASGLLEALDVDRDVAVVGIDAGVPVAWGLAALRPDLVDRVALMEGLLGTLPGAERFLAAGPPWWFGFHAVPGLAEEVLEGHEAAYVDFFLRAGTADGGGVDAPTRAAFVAAYTGRESLRGGFEHYRALPGNGRRIAELAAAGPGDVPTLAVAGGVVGDAIAGQLGPITRDLVVRRVADCGHLIPLEQPAALSEHLVEFLGSAAPQA